MMGIPANPPPPFIIGLTTGSCFCDWFPTLGLTWLTSVSRPTTGPIHRVINNHLNSHEISADLHNYITIDVSWLLTAISGYQMTMPHSHILSCVRSATTSILINQSHAQSADHFWSHVSPKPASTPRGAPLNLD